MPTQPAILVIDDSVDNTNLFYVDNLLELPQDLQDALNTTAVYTGPSKRKPSTEAVCEAFATIAKHAATLEKYYLEKSVPAFPVGRGLSDGKLQIIMAPIWMVPAMRGEQTVNKE